MSFIDMLANAKSSSGNDADYFFPECRGEMEIERVINHNGENGHSVILVGTILSCKPTVEGGRSHAPGARVKKVYAISKFPKPAMGQLKRDLLAIEGLKETDMSPEETKNFFGAVLSDTKSPLFEMRGYHTSFSTKTIDRSEKGKSTLTGVTFQHIENDPDELAKRAKEISKRLDNK